MVANRLVKASRSGAKVVAVISAMGDSTDELARLAHRYSPAPPIRELDALMSVGECVACALTAIAIHELGGTAVSLTGPQAGVLTDHSHGGARLTEIQPRRVLETLDQGHIALVTGFQGVAPTGDVTTLGRGGSDTSAVALAAALGLDRCDIFTDVTGVFTADPRVVPQARALRTVSHTDMLELAYGGAAVLQPRCVELADAHDIDIYVRSASGVDDGTHVRKENTVLEQTRIIGVAHRRHDPQYAVRDASPAAISSALARRGATIGTLVCLGDEVRFTAPGAAEGEVIAALDAAGAPVEVCDNLGTVTVVGSGVGNRPEVASRVLEALEQRGIDPHSLMSAASHVSCHVLSEFADEAARVLHHAFGLHVRDFA
jgi:aspartate kinase